MLDDTLMNEGISFMPSAADHHFKPEARVRVHLFAALFLPGNKNIRAILELESEAESGQSIGVLGTVVGKMNRCCVLLVRRCEIDSGQKLRVGGRHADIRNRISLRMVGLLDLESLFMDGSVKCQEELVAGVWREGVDYTAFDDGRNVD